MYDDEFKIWENKADSRTHQETFHLAILDQAKALIKSLPLLQSNTFRFLYEAPGTKIGS